MVNNELEKLIYTKQETEKLIKKFKKQLFIDTFFPIFSKEEDLGLNKKIMGCFTLICQIILLSSVMYSNNLLSLAVFCPSLAANILLNIVLHSSSINRLLLKNSKKLLKSTEEKIKNYDSEQKLEKVNVSSNSETMTQETKSNDSKLDNIREQKKFLMNEKEIMLNYDVSANNSFINNPIIKIRKK